MNVLGLFCLINFELLVVFVMLIDYDVLGSLFSGEDADRYLFTKRQVLASFLHPQR